MNKFSCLIIDDEPPAIQLLKKYCTMVEQLELKASFQSAVEAFDFFKNDSVDLMFLDIQMPVINGIEFIKSLKNPPSVIMTTAYRDYAVEGFDLDIVDYLLKPISFDRFLKSIDRFRSKHTEEVRNSIKEKSVDHVFFNVNKKNHKIEFRDILYLESLKDYVKIHTKNKNLVVKGNLGTILKKLPSSIFIRIHRSYAIAMPALKAYNQKAVEIADTTLPIGDSYKETFLQKLNA